MSAPFLQIENLCKSFGSIQALQNISIDIHAEELMVVLGPTGAGKTTLLRTIAGLESPDSGHLFMNGENITNSEPTHRDVALVFQNFSLYPNKTVRQNLAFPLRTPGRNLSKSQITKKVEHTAEILHITALLDRPSPHLSGGEMQRVAIGRAIVRQPRLFLMDEPLSNLDAKLRESLRVELVRLQRELAIPMIYVTHDQVEALSMGDRITVLSEGQVLQTSTPEEIYERPTSPRVARQLGYPPINLIDVQKQNEQWITASNTAILSAKQNAPSHATLGIRPENISLEGGRIPARIEVIEELGPSTILLVKWAGESVYILVLGERRWQVGDEIYPQIDAERVMVWLEEKGTTTFAQG
jgi:multiple sugar transport system ATP-binding protein